MMSPLNMFYFQMLTMTAKQLSAMKIIIVLSLLARKEATRVLMLKIH